MYNDLSKKCKSMIEELNAIRPDLLDESKIKDIQAEAMIKAIDRACNGLHGVIDTIKAYYTGD